MSYPLNGDHGQHINGAHPPVPEEHLDSASDDSQHSDQSSVISINSVEIAEHFEDRHGRRFHSHGNLYAYPLPSDDREIVVSALFYECSGGSYGVKHRALNRE